MLKIDMSRMDMNKETAKRELDRELIYNRAFETPIVGMTIFDMDQNVVFCNATARKIFELERDAVGVNVRDFLNKESKNLIDTVVLPALDKTGSWQGELVGKLKDGREVPLSASCVVIYDEDGKPHAILATYRDITDRKQAEKKLRESEKRYYTLFENASDAVLIADAKTGELLYANKMAEILTGKSRNELIGMHQSTLHPPEDVEHYKKAFRDHVRTPSTNVEAIVMKKDGTRIPVSISANIFELGGKKVIQGIFRDITERKRMEDKLKNHSEKLEQKIQEKTKELLESQKKLITAEKLAAIGEVATRVGHDIRNPLTSIKGAAYYLKTDKNIKLNKNAKKMLDTIDDSIKYADKILTDLLDFSSEIKLKPVRKTVKEVVVDAISSITIPKKVNIIDSTESEPTIRVDTILIRRVLHNVFINAFEAMPEGGTLKIESKKNVENVSIKICDSGTGIPKKVIKKLFTPFFTTKARGVGLGLPICKRIVEAHGGSIGVESKAGKGTCVTIILPKNKR